MTARKRLRVVLAAVAALLLVVVAPAAPAAATDEYLIAPCATGAITSATGIGYSDGLALAVLTGWAQPCADVPATTKFGFVHYYATGAVLPLDDTLGTGLRGYAPATGPTGFEVAAQLSAMMNQFLIGTYGPLTAICLVRSHDARLACVSADYSGPGTLPAPVPISVDDARVRVPVVAAIVGGAVIPTTGYCGNCI